MTRSSDDTTPAADAPSPAGVRGSLLSRLFNRYTLIAFLAGPTLAVAIGASAFGLHQGMGANMTPAQVQAHVDHVLKHFYVEIDATDAQKAQIGPLVQQAVSDILPMHAQLRAAHREVMTALERTPVDRTALEAARTAHLQLADQATKRLTQLFADVGDTLTPQQRTQFVEHLAQLHAARGGGALTPSSATAAE